MKKSKFKHKFNNLGDLKELLKDSVKNDIPKKDSKPIEIKPLQK